MTTPIRRYGAIFTAALVLGACGGNDTPEYETEWNDMDAELRAALCVAAEINGADSLLVAALIGVADESDETRSEAARFVTDECA